MEVNWRKSRVQHRDSGWRVNWRKSRVQHRENGWRRTGERAGCNKGRADGG